MAGRRHHHIQQHLSRGFGIDTTRRPVHVWAFRRDTEPYTVATEKYGIEKDFYGSPSDTAVDDAITLAESAEINPLIDFLRTAPEGAVADPVQAARFVQHLIFRSKYLRSVFSDALTQMLQTAIRQMLQPDRLRPFLRELVTRHVEQLVNKAETTGGWALTTEQRNLATSFLRINGPALADEFLRTQWPLVEFGLAAVVKQAPQLIAAAHQDALKKRLDDTSGAREAELRSLRWTIHISQIPLVLGDTCTFSELVDGSFAPLPDKGVVAVRVLVPIATDRFLMGSECRDRPDPRRVVHGAVVCSFDSFCAASDSGELRQLQHEIGTSSIPVPPSEIERIALDSVGESMSRILSEGFK